MIPTGFEPYCYRLLGLKIPAAKLEICIIRIMRDPQ